MLSLPAIFHNDQRKSPAASFQLVGSVGGQKGGGAGDDASWSSMLSFRAIPGMSAAA